MKSMLIVEDDVVFCKMLGRFLASKNFTTIEATNASEANDLIKSKVKIDFALIDQKLPDGEGDEVLRKLLEVNPKAKVFMMSRFYSDEQHKKFLELGALDFIKKPIRPNELLSVLNEYI